MRHASLKTTMDYYANIDTAVEEAVMGLQRNTSRNTMPEKASGNVQADDASPFPGGTNSF
jgi:hypothetical protein